MVLLAGLLAGAPGLIGCNRGKPSGAITLSGTVNLTNNGQPAEWVHILAKTADDKVIGMSGPLDLPADNAPWSMTIPVIDADLTFWVFGVGNDEWLLDRVSILPVSVHSQDKSGIDLNAGDIRNITLLGAVSVTPNLRQVPDAGISEQSPEEDSNSPVIELAEIPSPAAAVPRPVTTAVPAPAPVNTAASVNNQEKAVIVPKPADTANSGKNESDRSIDNYTRAIQNDPNNASAYNNRAYAYFYKGNYDLAIADYTQAARINPNDAAAYNNRGVAYRNKGESEKAIADYTQAIRIDPNYAAAYNNRGYVYNNRGDHDRAIADYTQAIKIDSKYATAYNNRGSAYFDKKDYNRAIEDYTKAIQMDPNYADAYYNRANAHVNKKNYDLAIADLNQAIRLKPDFTSAHELSAEIKRIRE